ncbi:hypothetical protein [Streptomyces cinereoruber]|uniref:hypothetical protein n=1 Tax=Streptomyces cinereoruber TaxID=67260 RepID=UPI003625492D
MRLAPDVSAGPSPTPIYDALYSEYRRSFRSLPGDRSGEEGLAFRAFGTTLGAGGPGQELAGALREVDRPLDELCDDALAGLLDGQAQDDVAMLLARTTN